LFGEAPKILDRNFVIGYFLPAFAFVVASLAAVHQVVHLTDILVAPLDSAKLGAVRLILPLLFAVTLLALNRRVFQLFEGYGTFNPVGFFGLAIIRHELLASELRRITDLAEHAEGEVLSKLEIRARELMGDLVERFPPEGIPLLPTSLGNAMSAFEEYAREMYGFDAVEGWPRLLTVIPEDFRNLIDSSKAETDFWINLWLTSILVAIDYISSKLIVCVGIFRKSLWLQSVPPLQPNGVVILVSAFLLSWAAAHWATLAAIEWGAMIKTSFDVYLPKLYSKLGFAPANTESHLRDTWTAFAQAVVYRLPDQMPMRFGARNGKKTQPL
jgi:hypothetical protein